MYPKQLLIIASLCFVLSYSFGQEYLFKSVDLKTGLPSLNVRSIYQDDIGYIWMGTSDGLVRYDGSSVKIFHSSNGLISDQINCITQYSSKSILVGTENGLMALDFSGKIISRKLTGISVSKIIRIPSHECWIIATSEGLYCKQDTTISKIKTGRLIDSVAISTLTLDKNQDVWIGTKKTGLYKFGFKSSKGELPIFEYKHYLDSLLSIRDLYCDENGKLWIAALGQGIYYIDKNGLNPIPLELDGSEKLLYTSTINGIDGAVYFGTWGSGAVKYEDEKLVFFDKTNGLGDDVVVSILIDREKTPWFGTFSSGMKRPIGSNIVMFNSDYGFGQDNVRGVNCANNGNVYVSTLSGLYTLNQNKKLAPFDIDDSGKKNRMGSIVQYGEDELIVVGYDGSLVFINTVANTTRKEEPNFPTNEFMCALWKKENDRVYIGTRESGFLYYEKDKFYKIGSPELNNRIVWSLKEDKHGLIWLATDQGIFSFDESSDKISKLNFDALKNDFTVNDLEVIGDDLFLATSGYGVIQYDTKAQVIVKMFNEDLGLSGNFARSIYAVNDSMLMVGTNHGLNLLNYRVDGEKECVSLISRHSFPLDYNPAAIAKGENNHIWIGTSDGVLKLELKEMITSEVPNFIISGVYAGDRSLLEESQIDEVNNFGIPSKITLPYNDNSFDIDQSTIAFGERYHRNLYYRISGKEKGNWKKMPTNHTLHYSNLQPGNYLVEISNDPTSSIDPVKVLEVKILAPYYKTWWFYLVLISGLVFIVLLRLLWSRRKRNKMEKVIASTKKELLLAEQGYALLVEQSLDIMYETNLEGEFTFINESIEKAIGYTKQEIIKLKFTDLIIPAHREMVAKHYAACFTNENELNEEFEFQVTTKSGNLKWVSQKVRSLQDPDHPGRIFGFHAVARDITLIKKQEDIVRNNEENLRILAESMTDVYWLADVKTSNTVYVNESFKEIFERPKETLIEDSNSWADQIVESDRERVLEAFNEKAAKGEFEETYQIQMDDGRRKWLYSVALPIRNKEGELVKMSGITRDITKVKTKEILDNRIAEFRSFLHFLGSSFLGNADKNLLIENIALGMDAIIDPILKMSILSFDNVEKKIFHHSALMKEGEPMIFEQGILPFEAMNSMETTRNGEITYAANFDELNLESEGYKESVDFGIRCYLVVPLMDSKEVFGALAFGFKNEDPLAAKGITVDLFREMGLSTSSLLTNHRMMQEVVYHSSEMVAGINYAKNIQRTILPNEALIEKHVKNHFILYEPKDLVSGDFYWAFEIPETNELIFAVVDCTGHGVPGAFVSLIAYRFLQRATEVQKIYDPGEILTELNKNIIQTMKADEENELHDGMDIVIARIDRDSNVLRYSTAVNHLWMVDNEGELILNRTSFRSIGDSIEENFETHTVNVLPGFKFYFMSDGFVDQLGGEKNNKILRKRLKSLILENHDKSMADQRTVYLDYFVNWRGAFPQTDDLTLCGFEF